MPFRKTLIAALIAAAAGPACIRSDAGGECRNTLECGEGLHCEGGACRSDCTSDAQCPAGSGCSPTGECLRIDNLKCEEGDVPAPAAVNAAFPTDAELLLKSFTDPCGQLVLDQVPPGFGSSSELESICMRLGAVETNHLSYLGVPGQFADCRPAQIQAAEAVWHDILFDNPIDTALQARWSGSQIDFAVGHSPPDGGAPTPGTIWAKGSSADGGHTVALAVDGTVLRALVDEFAPASDAPDAVNTGGPFRIDATFTRDAGGTSLVESYRETGSGHDYEFRGSHRPGATVLQLRDEQDPSDPVFTFQFLDDFSGRLDDARDGHPRVLCWNVFTIANKGGFNVTQAHVVFSDSGGQRIGDPAACPFPEPVSP